MNELKTAEEVIAWLKNFSPSAIVKVDTFDLNGGSFEILVKDNSPIDSPNQVFLRLTDGYSHSWKRVCDTLKRD